MLNCIIVDDQAYNIEIIEQHIKNVPELNVLKTFTNPHEALDFLQNHILDIAFLDIKMPKLSGMEIIEAIKANKSLHLPMFILTTGFSDHAIPAFDIGVVDYLIKPVGFNFDD